MPLFSVFKYANRVKCLFYSMLLFPFQTKIKHHFYRKNLNKEIWIVGENTGVTLRDNGYCFFKYCQKNSTSQIVYFVAGRKAILNDPYLNGHINSVIYGSLKHILLLYCASTFIFTHTHRDIIYHSLLSLFFKNQKLVRLQHGVIGLKKFSPRDINTYKNYDLIISTAEWEKKIIQEHVKIDAKKVKNTGLARYDYLTDTSSFNDKFQILYMPTWRDWIQSKKSFANSKYLKKISAFLKSEKLHTLLNENNATLIFFLHTRMDNFSFGTEWPSNIKCLCKRDVSVQSLIKKSNLLLTDYSSVSWDFIYLNKPVIFYQFDVEDYLAHRGAYLDFKKDMAGKVVYTKNSLISTLEVFFQQKESLKNGAVRLNPLFTYVDNKNCKRIYDSISNLK